MKKSASISVGMKRAATVCSPHRKQCGFF